MAISASRSSGEVVGGSETIGSRPGPITPAPFRKPIEIECWGHRGASAHLPENTLASFRAAIEEGADGIESDVHATSDGVILMFHDPTLDRTTTGKGLIRKQPWQDVIEHVRTKAEPIQPIPLFEELVALLMEPGHRHVSLNIDCKMQNDPEMLFPEMARIIALYPGWETELAPRLILGLWHPLFLRAAYKYLPLLRRYHIGFSPAVVERYFWDACDGFSLNFALLMGSEGQAFLKKCREAGKEICLWTVNDPGEMRVAMSWGVKAILTDRVGAFTFLRKEIAEEPERLELTGLSRWTFPWSHWRYYSVAHVCANRLAPLFLSAHGALPNSTSYPTRNEPTAAYNHNLPHTTIDAMSTPGDFDTTHPPPSDLDRPDPPMSSPLSDRVASYLPGG